MKKLFNLSLILGMLSIPVALFSSSPPVAHFPFAYGHPDGLVHDYGSYATNCAISGVVRAPGIISPTDTGAYYFDGINDLITAGTSNRGVTNRVTVSAWIKTTSNSASTQTIVAKYDYTVQKGYDLLINSGKAKFDGRDGSGNYRSSGFSTTNVADGQWHHITGVVNIDHWEIWVDGVKEGEQITGYASTDLTNTQALGIGYLPISYGFFYQGVIDEVAIYDYALSGNEIAVLSLNKNLTCFYPFAGNAQERTDTYADGTLLGAPTLATGHTSVANSAYSFDGNDQISAGNVGLNISHSITVAAWIRTTSLSTQFVVFKYNTRGFHLYTSNGFAGFSGRDGSGLYRACTGNVYPIADGNWHLLVGVVNNGTWQIWVDGNKDFELATGYANTNLQFNTPLVIGFNVLTYSNYFTGTIDDVRIYNKALSSSEIGNLTNFNVEALRKATPGASANSEPVSTHGIEIYPNPVEDIIQINAHGIAFEKMEIADVHGKIMMEVGSSSQLSLNALPAGLYIVSFKDINGQTLSISKFIKK